MTLSFTSASNRAGSSECKDPSFSLNSHVLLFNLNVERLSTGSLADENDLTLQHVRRKIDSLWFSSFHAQPAGNSRMALFQLSHAKRLE